MSELSPEIKRLLREFKESQQREATSEDLRKVLEPLIPKVIEEESVFIRKARLVLEPPKEEEKLVQKQATKPKEQKSTLSPLQRAFVWFTTKIEEVRQQVEGLKERLTKGHESGVNADKVDDLHAQEIAQRALDIMQAGKGGGIYAGFDKYTDVEAISAVEGEPTLDLTGVIPNSAYPNALLLDGTRAMTGDLDLATNLRVIKIGSTKGIICESEDTAVCFTSGGDVRITNSALVAGTLKDFRCNNLYSYGNLPLLDNKAVQNVWQYGANFHLRNLHNSGWLNFATLQSESSAGAKDGGFILYSFTDATRGNAGTAGRVIFNSDDGALNVDDGTDWRDTDGNIT